MIIMGDITLKRLQEAVVDTSAQCADAANGYAAATAAAAAAWIQFRSR